MNNKILQQTQRLGRETLPPAVQFALACRIRNKEDEPEVKGAYAFDKSDFSYEQEDGKHHRAKNEYKTPEGVKCRIKEAAKCLGLSETRTSVLFTKYASDYKHIYANYGKARGNMNYKTDQGEPTTAQAISDHYKIVSSTVFKIYKVNNNDYLKANAELFEKFNNRVLR